MAFISKMYLRNDSNTLDSPVKDCLVTNSCEGESLLRQQSEFVILRSINLSKENYSANIKPLLNKAI